MENKDTAKSGGFFEIKVYRNSKEAGIDLWSRIRKFFGIAVPAYEPIKVIRTKNKMTNASLAVITGLVGNTGAQNAFTYLALGTSSTAVSAGSTALGGEIVTNGLQRASATVTRTTTAQTNDTLSLSKTFTATGSSTVEEIGIFNASSSGVMLARALTGTTPLANGYVVTATYTWQIVGN